MGSNVLKSENKTMSKLYLFSHMLHFVLKFICFGFSKMKPKTNRTFYKMAYKRLSCKIFQDVLQDKRVDKRLLQDKRFCKILSRFNKIGV